MKVTSMQNASNSSLNSLQNPQEALIPSTYYIPNIGLVFLNKDNKTCLNYLTGIKRLKENFQELLYDNVGKYACFGYQKMREKCDLYEEKVQNLLRNQAEFSSYHLEFYEEVLKMREKYLKYKSKFKTIQNYRGLSNADLQDLTEILTKALNQGKNEQIHRIYQDQIKELKNQISPKENISADSPQIKPKKVFKYPINISEDLDKEKQHISELFIHNTTNTTINSFNFEEFETNFLNNPLEFDYLLKKSTEPAKSPLNQKIAQSFQAKTIEKPIEKPIERVLDRPMTKHQKTKSLLPNQKTPNKIPQKKTPKRGVSVEKVVNISISSRKTEEKSQDLVKLKDLIEDKRILTETFVMNKPLNYNENSNEKNQENFMKKDVLNLKEDAENLKNFVQKVSNTIHANMDCVQAKMQKPNCQFKDFFSEKDFFSNEHHNEEIFKNYVENNNNLNENNNLAQVSNISLDEDFMKKRRTRAERNNVKKND